MLLRCTLRTTTGGDVQVEYERQNKYEILRLHSYVYTVDVVDASLFIV